jgi:hypothetical protein
MTDDGLEGSRSVNGPSGLVGAGSELALHGRGAAPHLRRASRELDSGGSEPRVAAWPAAERVSAREGEDPGHPVAATGAVVLPDLSGLLPRTAARRLHAAGLSVLWEGTGGAVRSTRPGAGAVLTAGDTVRVVAGPGGGWGGDPGSSVRPRP